MLGEPGTLILWTFIVIIIGFFVCSLGLQNGVERISKVMMIALFALSGVVVAETKAFFKKHNAGK